MEGGIGVVCAKVKGAFLEELLDIFRARVNVWHWIFVVVVVDEAVVVVDEAVFRLQLLCCSGVVVVVNEVVVVVEEIVFCRHLLCCSGSKPARHSFEVWPVPLNRFVGLCVSRHPALRVPPGEARLVVAV
jgi:hypothetical protein